MVLSAIAEILFHEYETSGRLVLHQLGHILADYEGHVDHCQLHLYGNKHIRRHICT